MRLAIILAALLSLDSAAVKIHTDRTVLYAGTTLIVDCIVARHRDNRKVTALVTGYTSSERQLDGEDSPIRHRFEFKFIPCDAIDARCVLLDAYDRAAVALQPLEIAGCEP